MNRDENVKNVIEKLENHEKKAARTEICITKVHVPMSEHAQANFAP